MNEEKQEQINTLFQYNSKVKIIYGFYKDRTGIVKKVYTKALPVMKYPQNKIPKGTLINDSPIIENWYEVEIMINDRKMIIELNELHLDLIKPYRPFPLNLFK